MQQLNRISPAILSGCLRSTQLGANKIMMLLSQFCRIAVLVVCWVGLDLFRSSHTTSAAVTVPRVNPDKNFTVYYSSDKNVSYTCIVEEDGAEPVWEITCLHDGCISLQLLTPQLKYETGEWLVMEEVNNRSTLVVMEEARRKQNMSIVCLSHSPDSFVLNPPVSKSYYITTYGPLSAPSKLELTIDSNGQHIFSWISPRVPQDVVLTCSVTALNLSSGNTLLDINTTDHYVGVLDSTRPKCSEVMFTVYCVNIEDDNARSNVSTKMENLPLSPDVVSVENFTVLLKLKAGLISLEIITKTANVCSKAYPVTWYHVNIDNDALGIRNTVSFNARGNDNGTQTIRFLLNSTNAPFLALNQVLNTSVTVCSSITCHTTGNVTLYVAPIQNPIIYYSNRSVALVCDVLKSSQATGCLFNLTSAGIDGNINVEMFNVTMTSESKCDNDNCKISSCNTTKSIPTNYLSINVYAINQNGTVSNFSQPVTLINGTSDSEYSDCFEMQGSADTSAAIVGGAVGGVLGVVVILGVVLLIILLLVFRRKPNGRAEVAARYTTIPHSATLFDEAAV